eukprot:TRINITY_DN797_c1_g1_i12.p1 TRINITY_DN797_c1_g1~~TRINITY_DN797_c1_g1_i12.p1  ORF type:complete len:178 (+),score=43.88 TRINITY_DN797_c1_g1_i12:62-535(+)
MSVELLVQHPGGEWMEVEVGPMESLAGLKERVASQSGMCVNTFDLSFEGEVFGDSDGRLVGELPFGDRSELQLVLNKKEVALHRLKELGWAGKVCMLQFLLSNGVSIADSYGSPFGAAVELGNTEIISMLLEAGAGVNLKYSYGDTPLIKSNATGLH